MAGLQPDALDELVATHIVTHNEYEMKKEHPELDVASAESFEPDGIHDGLEFPTEAERLTLRRVSDTLPWASYLIAFVELAERFSYYGASVVFTNFIQQPLPDGSHTGAGGGGNGQSGALGKGQQASSGLVTFYGFWAYVVPLLGAYIADAHWGRYKTIFWAIMIALVGHIILIVSAVPGVIEKTEGATACFVIGMIVTGFGRNKYQRSPPEGSVLATALHLFAFAARGRWSWNPVKLWNNFNTDDFWEGAKPSRVANKPKWMTFDDQWVEEVQRGLKACAVFTWYPIYWLSYNQLTNNLISQAATMDVHGVPNDVLGNLDPLALIIFIPICDLLFFPLLKRVGINFTALKKITAGFFTGALAMIWATVVQYYIYKASSMQCTDPCGNMADSLSCESVSPLNVWIQTGSYVLVAFSEIFASITGLEYAFTKAPKNMRSLVMSVFFFQSALGSALSEAWLPLLVDPLLTWNYGSIAIISTVGGVLFWLSVRKLDIQEDKLNNLATGHIHAQDHPTNEKSV
ncbi:hypothetical protein HHX47_DHR10000303 [Lentinula edodes]|nr:hypothetical protein HHX47_DHR10000303 [Lentinula edodes]